MVPRIDINDNCIEDRYYIKVPYVRALGSVSHNNRKKQR